jgi:hypothetical protein
MRKLPILVALASLGIGVVSTIFIYNRRARNPQVIISKGCIPSDCAVSYDADLVAQRIKENDDPEFFAAFQELPLYAMPACVEEAYSLEWLPAFNGPVTVRVWSSQNRYFMVAKVLDSKGWSKFGKVAATNARELTSFEWRSFTDLLMWNSFWQTPSTVNETSPNDGAVWLLNGWRRNEYHWVRRRVPDDRISGPSHYLIQLSGLPTGYELYTE